MDLHVAEIGFGEHNIFDWLEVRWGCECTWFGRLLPNPRFTQTSTVEFGRVVAVPIDIFGAGDRTVFAVLRGVWKGCGSSKVLLKGNISNSLSVGRIKSEALAAFVLAEWVVSGFGDGEGGLKCPKSFDCTKYLYFLKNLDPFAVKLRNSNLQTLLTSLPSLIWVGRLLIRN